MAEVLVERRRVALLLRDVDVDVWGVAPAELPDDHRRADDPPLRPVDEDEHVLALPGVFDRAREALLSVVEESADLVAVRRQVDRVQVPGHLVELLLVLGHSAADLVARCDRRHESSVSTK